MTVETTDGRRESFEVVGLVEDDEGHGFAVCYSGAADQFVVTDADGELLKDAELAQEILDEFLEQAEESAEEEGGEAQSQ